MNDMFQQKIRMCALVDIKAGLLPLLQAVFNQTSAIIDTLQQAQATHLKPLSVCWCAFV